MWSKSGVNNLSKVVAHPTTSTHSCTRHCLEVLTFLTIDSRKFWQLTHLCLLMVKMWLFEMLDPTLKLRQIKEIVAVPPYFVRKIWQAWLCHIWKIFLVLAEPCTTEQDMASLFIWALLHLSLLFHHWVCYSWFFHQWETDVVFSFNQCTSI